MSATAPKTLSDALKRGTFDGAYYICGEDDFQKEDAMRQLIEAAVEPAMLDFNMEIKRAQDTDAKSLDAALSALPMMADRRVVVIRDASALKKDVRKVMDRYLSKPSPDVLLLLVETSGGKTEKDLAKNSTSLEFDFLTADEIPKWIAHYASTQFQMRISAEATELLQSAVGTDLHQLVAELDKLASFVQGHEIVESDVTAVVGVRRGETMADFLDEIARRNVPRALELVPQILSQPKTTAVSLVMALATQTIALAWGRARRNEGLSQSRLQSEYFGFLKQSGSAFTGRPWGSAVAAWTGAVDRWNEQSLGRALDSLLEADIALKETRFSSEEQVMATLVLSMCVDDERSIAA
ncbi:MAG: DNA polymerase III subunit delta [Gemmatimonadaceae bacterium]|nr:DNA polymerase III subunit delta [Gemmatimonadaceae bacterium]